MQYKIYCIVPRGWNRKFFKFHNLPYEPRVGMLIYGIEPGGEFFGNPLEINKIALRFRKGDWELALYLKAPEKEVV